MSTKTRIVPAGLIATALTFGSIAGAVPSAHALDTPAAASGDKDKDKAKEKAKHKPQAPAPHKPNKPNDKPKP
jgi:hypothetical protein